MKMVGTVVGGEAVIFTIQGESSPGDSIRAAPDHRAEIGILWGIPIVLRVAKAQDDIGESALPIFCLDRSNRRARVDQADFDAG